MYEINIDEDLLNNPDIRCVLDLFLYTTIHIHTESSLLKLDKMLGGSVYN